MIGITEWTSVEALAAWRENPEHRKAQERGRQAFYAEYEITVCTTLREYSFKDAQRTAQ
jgi:heme-degrading monooxygenase HmoA